MKAEDTGIGKPPHTKPDLQRRLNVRAGLRGSQHDQGGTRLEVLAFVRQHFGKFLSLGVLTLHVGLAHSAGFPDRPITLVVPFVAGSGTDVVARVVGQKLSERLGVAVVIDNKAGAGGNIGSQAVARANPDGYTLLVATVANPIGAYVGVKPGYDFVRDLAPITLLTSAPLLIYARQDHPASSLPELIALAKRKPSEVTFGTGSVGTATYLVGDMLRAQSGVQFTQVPYKSATAAMVDLMGGRVDFAVDNLAGVYSMLKDRKIKALAVSTAKRSALLPLVPTVTEAGLKDFEASGWLGLNAPARTPQDVIAKLNREVGAVLNDPAIKQRLEAEGAASEATSPEQYRQFIAREMDKWAKVAKQTGVTPQ